MDTIDQIVEDMNDVEHMEFLNGAIHDCHTFLQKWKVLITDRGVATEDAFIAITELEKEIRERRETLGRITGQTYYPF